MEFLLRTRVSIGVVLLLAVYSTNTFGQAAYMKGNVRLYMKGYSAHWKKFYQISSKAEVNLLGNAAFHCYGDSLRIEGVWTQTSSSSVHFNPVFDNIQSLYVMKFQTSNQIVFRNAFFDGITTEQGLLITDKSDGTVAFDNDFNLPPCPVYLGSKERTPRSDYIKDVDKKFILQTGKSIRFKNVSRSSYIVTSSKSIVRARIASGQSLKFPIGYSRNYFTPVEINAVSQEDVFDVAASPWMYDWDPSFLGTEDKTTKKNIKKNGIELMWYIKAGEDITTADIYTQVDLKSPLIQPAYDKLSSTLVRYVGVPDNQVGTALSKSFWDYSATRHNTNTSIYPNVVNAVAAHVLLRNSVGNMNSYAIFSASSWKAADNSPLSAKVPAVKWGAVTIEQATNLKNNVLKWAILEEPFQVSEYELVSSSEDIIKFPEEIILRGFIAHQSNLTNYSWELIPSSLYPPTTQYRIRPVPINEQLDTLVYIYNPYHFTGQVNPASGVAGSISLYNNPVSIAEEDFVTFKINTIENVAIKSVDINIVSPTAVERMIFTKRLRAPLASDLSFSLNAKSLNLSPGLYVVIAEVVYEDERTSRLHNKFIVY